LSVFCGTLLVLAVLLVFFFFWDGQMLPWDFSIFLWLKLSFDDFCWFSGFAGLSLPVRNFLMCGTPLWLSFGIAWYG
jgi:hypothetical protein